MFSNRVGREVKDPKTLTGRRSDSLDKAALCYPLSSLFVVLNVPDANKVF